jgi:DNA invertase Pin-like site-specific DNA recombinase
MEKVSAYIRCSSESQIENTGLTVQRDRIEKYCVLKGLELVHVYVDPGVSGSIPICERPEGSKLMQSVRDKEIVGIIISKLDRMFRSTVDCLTTVDQLDKVDCSLHIVDLGGTSIDSRSVTGRFMLTVMAAAIEMERGQIRERVASGRKQRIKEQRPISRCPFGYKIQEEKVDGKSIKTLIPNPKEFAALQLIRQLRPTTSLPKIAATLNSGGHVTQNGRSWTSGHVQGILRRVSI